MAGPAGLGPLMQGESQPDTHLVGCYYQNALYVDEPEYLRFRQYFDVRLTLCPPCVGPRYLQTPRLFP